MSKWRRKPEPEIEAVQWNEEGDHPAVEMLWKDNPADFEEPCGKMKSQHGWVNTAHGGFTVCPGEWLIIDNARIILTCSSEYLNQQYEQIQE